MVAYSASQLVAGLAANGGFDIVSVDSDVFELMV